MQRRTAIFTFLGLLAAAGLVLGLTANGLLNLQGLDKLAPKAKRLFFPDGGLLVPSLPALAPPADAGQVGVPAKAADGGTPRADGRLKLRLAPGEGEGHAPEPVGTGLLNAAMTLAQSTCGLSGKVTMKDRSSPAGRVIVYVEQVPPDSWQRDKQTTPFTVHKGRVEPGLAAIVRDDGVRFLNPEGGDHAIFSRSGANDFALAQSKQTLLGTQWLGYRGAVHLQCDVDEAISADVLVLANPFFALVGANGDWKIDGVPKGERSVVAWEPNGGTTTQLVKCAGDTPVALTLEPLAPTPRKHRDGTPYR